METGPVPFVILTAPRTGSTLLVRMLDSHPDVVAGGEFFNVDLVQRGIIDWPLPGVRTDAELVELRRSDPVAFLGRMRDHAGSSGAKVAGFKLIYDQALQPENERVVASVRDDANIRIVHLRRRNLLRQFLSLRIAAKSGVWHRAAKQTDDAREKRTVHLDPDDMIGFFRRVQRRWETFEEQFASHPIIGVDYEDLQERPQEAAASVLDFLGVERRPLEIKLRKTGPDDLAASIENFDELKALVDEWASFFDD